MELSKQSENCRNKSKMEITKKKADTHKEMIKADLITVCLITVCVRLSLIINTNPESEEQKNNLIRW